MPKPGTTTAAAKTTETNPGKAERISKWRDEMYAAACHACHWYLPDSDRRGQGNCAANPPTVIKDQFGAILSRRPVVQDHDRCRTFLARPQAP